MTNYYTLKNLISPKKQANKQFLLDLTDSDKQTEYESNRLNAVLQMLKILYLNKLQNKIASNKSEIAKINEKKDFDAADYKQIQSLYSEINALQSKIDGYKPFFTETYFARMDVEDDVDGYNSYYIGKRGDEGLEIVDWRAPFARRYYQKTNLKFSINQFNYKLVLRRALRVHSGKVEDLRNEYLSLKDYIPQEELAGKEEDVNFDPFLKDILQSRKEKNEITDIIETIQEKQYEIITAPKDNEFYVQGVAGSGKTMILLHRLSYLLYNFDDLKANDVLIITPSDSFNDFIDELAVILELGKVKTMTLDTYYDAALSSVGIKLAAKIDADILPDERYLSYVYSEKFANDANKKLTKIKDGICGLFKAETCVEFVDDIVKNFSNLQTKYEKIKNASTRVRRCVLGEIKEKTDGGLYYTKQFRTLFNSVYTVKEFLTETLYDESIENSSYFYTQLSAFYKAMRFIRIHGENTCSVAMRDLNALTVTVNREINDLLRYKTQENNKTVFTYGDNIARKKEILAETEKTLTLVQEICDGLAAVYDFTEVIKGDRNLVAIGKSESRKDIIKHFYKEIVKPAKRKFGIQTSKICAQDRYCLCLISNLLGFNLTPKHAYLFIDEAQDVAATEYTLLKSINKNAKINVFGDLRQNITPYRGIKSWNDLKIDGYNLNLNYRNTNQIVEFVAKNLNVDMKPIGMDGVEVRRISKDEISDFFSDKKGLTAIITTPAQKSKYTKKIYNVLSKTGKISKTKINVMTVYESKGLEFSAVVVADCDMTDNEKYIAYTRALYALAIV